MATPKKMGSRETPAYERKIQLACQRLSEKALEYLVKVLTDDTIDVRWRIVAAKEIFDRGLGRPRQQVDQKVTMVGGDAFMEVLNAAKARVEAQTAIQVVQPPEVVH